MQKGSFVFAFVALAISTFRPAECKNWALLVAGSNTYDNYRHQADISHGYHILRNHGIPAENIVTMMFDDIAYNEINPFKGNIINHPDGPNLYPGLVIDYRTHDVNSQIFLAVLSGDKNRVQELTGHDGRVIESGPDDYVFVNFADHGAPGLLCFPIQGYLHARTLRKTLEQMHAKKKYKKMVIYVEACYSGSMFASNLPKDLNVYAVTAARPDESSYACYYDHTRMAYLGDVFSVTWMQDSDKENLEKETLKKQYNIVRNKTAESSDVMEYGDLSIASFSVAQFQGNESSRVLLQPSSFQSPLEDAVPAPEVSMKVLVHSYMAAKSRAENRKAAKAMVDLMKHNSALDGLFQSIVGWLQNHSRRHGQTKESTVSQSSLTYQHLVKERRPITQWECYEQAVDGLSYGCKGLEQDYHFLQQLFVMVNLCESGYSGKDIRLAIQEGVKNHQNICSTTK